MNEPDVISSDRFEYHIPEHSFLLKSVAPLNVSVKSATFATFHCEMSVLKPTRPMNTLLIFVMAETSHLSMPHAPTEEYARHSLTALIRPAFVVYAGVQIEIPDKDNHGNVTIQSYEHMTRLYAAAPNTIPSKLMPFFTFHADMSRLKTLLL